MATNHDLARLVGKQIGHLELAVLDFLWRQREATSRDVFEAMREREKYGQSTILTVLRRLTARQVLNRTVRDGVFCYSRAITREELGIAMIDQVARHVFRGDMVAVIEHLVNGRTK